MKRKSWLSIMLLAALLCAWAIGGLAQEGVLTLPENLTKIEDEAFAGNTSLGEVVLPEGIETIGSRAFAGSTVSVINLPASITSIADDAFDGCGAIEVSAQEGSYAYDWAVEKGYVSDPNVTPVSSFEYSIENEEVIITGFVGNETVVVIPQIIEGYPVTSIGSSAFKNYRYLWSISISDGVTSIGDDAFLGCYNLTSISIPESVTSIEGYAFFGCSRLTSISIPESVTSIKGHTFSGCSSLMSVSLPDGVTSIGTYAFSNCSSLVGISIPEGVTSIESSAFSGCKGLENISIPESVTSIGAYAFSNCSSLMSISIPESVTSIEGRTFYNCSSLASITVDAKNTAFTSVEGVVFSDDLKELVCYPVGKVDTVYRVPDDVTSIENYAFYGCKNLKEIEFPDGVTSIENYAFGDCDGLVSITVPDSVTSIGASVFYSCNYLSSIELSESLTDIEYGVFSSCTSLTDITIPNSVTSIGEYAFSDCRNLISISIPDSVMSIAGHAFDGCSSLPSIVIPNSVVSIGSYVFEDCNSLANIEISNSVTNIESYTFYKCRGLTSIELPDSIRTIGGHAFYGCSNLISAIIPDSVTSIDNYAFYQCSNLKSVNLSNSVVEIQEGTFADCSSLTDIKIPDSVREISSDAFSYCSSLESVEIPYYVSYIGSRAFRNCSNLNKATIPNPKTSIVSDTFYGCSNLVIYSTTGSYAEIIAKNNNVTFKVAEFPVPEVLHPALIYFTLNATPLELTVSMGSQLVFDGTINAGSAKLMDVQASVFLASDHEQGAVYERAESNRGYYSYDLSGLSPMTVGAEYNGFAMTAGNSYDVMLYVTDENGNGFESDPYIRVHVVEDGEITWYAEITDEAGNALSSVTLPHTGEYAGRICVRTNNGDMTAWVDEGFPFDFALESVEPQDDGAYVFTYALSAPLILFDEVRTDTVLFCLRDENSTAITDTPLAQLTITQEGNPTPPEIFSITDREGNDLTTTPLKLDYTGACATDVIVHGNYAAITAWFNAVTTIDFGAPVETVLEDGTTQLVFSDVRAGENVTASDIARTCVFYAYTTDASNPDKSRTLGEIQVVQEANPNVPIVSDIWITHGDKTYDKNGPLQLVVGDHNYYDGYTLNVEVSNNVLANWTVYTDNKEVATAYRTKDGKLYVHAKAEGTAALYISYVYTEDFSTLAEYQKFLVCYIRVETPYHAIVIADPTYREYYVDSTKTQTAQGIVRRDLDSNRMIDLFESLSFDNETSINKVATPYPRETKSYDGPTTLAQLRGSCNMISQITSENSVTFVYILCHGGNDGSLWFGLDNLASISPTELKEMLDPIKGQIVLFLGSCHSGTMIADQTHDWVYTWTETIQIPVIGEWEKEHKEEIHVDQGVFTTSDKYHVITAANYDKNGKSPYDMNSFTIDSDGRAIIGESVGNLFTTGICSALPNSSIGTRTLEEVYTMANRYVTAYEGISDYPPQEMQRYPENDSTIVFQRVE